MIEPDANKIYQEVVARAKSKMGKIDPVYEELAARIAGGQSEYVPYLLAEMTNLDQARILQSLPDVDRDPEAGRSFAVSDEFARKLNLDKKVVDDYIQELFEKGLVFPTKAGPQMARTHIQLHDSTLGNPKFDESLGKVFFDLWAAQEQPMRQPVPEDLHPEGAPFRIIPRWKSIQDVPGVEKYEDIREILKSQETIAVIPCGCKRAHQDRWCEVPGDSCFVVGRTAEYNLSRGLGRKVTPEEALELMDKFDEYPVVNSTVNQKDVGQLICNCHYCCCSVVKGGAKSRFIAEVDPEKCRGCKLCIDRCQYGAITMKDSPEGGKKHAYVDPEICRGCGCCVISCPAEARTMKLVRPPEHIPDALGIY